MARLTSSQRGPSVPRNDLILRSSTTLLVKQICRRVWDLKRVRVVWSRQVIKHLFLSLGSRWGSSRLERIVLYDMSLYKGCLRLSPHLVTNTLIATLILSSRTRFSQVPSNRSQSKKLSLKAWNLVSSLSISSRRKRYFRRQRRCNTR